MLSIIVVLKNRFTNFCKMLEYLQKADHSKVIELVVVDFGSTDGNIMKAIKNLSLNGKVVKHAMPFRRSGGLNFGVEHSSGDKLLFLDADIIIPKNFLKVINNTVCAGTAFFPIGKKLNKIDLDKPIALQGKESKNFRMWWRGWGICAFTRDDFLKVGKWNESFVTCGKEDFDLFTRANEYGLKCVRKKINNLYHIYHPTSYTFRNRYFITKKK